MGKPARKTAVIPEAQGQRTISSFFQKPQSHKPNAGPRKLFTEVGSAGQTSTSWKTKHSLPKKDPRSTVLRDLSNKAANTLNDNMDNDVVVIEDSQHYENKGSSIKCDDSQEAFLNSDIKSINIRRNMNDKILPPSATPVKSCNPECSSVTPVKEFTEQSPDIIPDTPDPLEERSRLKRNTYTRSFLKPVSVLNGKPIIKPFGGLSAKRLRTRHPAKNPNQVVSVTFGISLDECDKITYNANTDDVAVHDKSVNEKHPHSLDNFPVFDGDQSDNLSSNSQELDMTRSEVVQRSVSQKRSADSGASPDAKRISVDPYDIDRGADIDHVAPNASSNCVLKSEHNESSSTLNKNVFNDPDFVSGSRRKQVLNNNVHKAISWSVNSSTTTSVDLQKDQIKKLNSYQIDSTNDGNSEPIPFKDDDLLMDILQEMQSTCNVRSPTVRKVTSSNDVTCITHKENINKKSDKTIVKNTIPVSIKGYNNKTSVEINASVSQNLLSVCNKGCSVFAEIGKTTEVSGEIFDRLTPGNPVNCNSLDSTANVRNNDDISECVATDVTMENQTNLQGFPICTIEKDDNTVVNTTNVSSKTSNTFTSTKSKDDLKTDVDIDNLNEWVRINSENVSTDLVSQRTNMNAVAECGFNLDDLSHDFSIDFTQLSPLRSIKDPCEKDNVPEFNSFINEYCRYTVTDVTRIGNDIVLSLQSTMSSNTICTLRGFWADTIICTGDIVHLHDAAFDTNNNSCCISDSEGLIIVNPDFLISGTSVVGGVMCRRRSVLNERFKGLDSGNIQMLYGSIMHSLFQKAIQKSIHETKELLSMSKDILQQSEFLHGMYQHGVVEETVLEEIQKYIAPFQGWIKQYTNIGKLALDGNRPASGLTISKVKDIEENIWSPRFGLKGKIDMTVGVKIWRSDSSKPEQKTVPLELKTGKTSFSAEHKGQVTLYSLMSSDRRKSPEEGLLLYLKEGKMELIPDKHHSITGLIQLRNEISHHLVKRTSNHRSNISLDICSILGKLPDPISQPKICSKCPQLINCTTYLKHVEQKPIVKDNPMYSLVPESLAHLSASHIDYFLHWCAMLQLESQASMKDSTAIKSIWTTKASDREKKGECLSKMMIESFKPTTVNGEVFRASFVRNPQYLTSGLCGGSLSEVGISIGETLVVSAENLPLIAICTGTVLDVTNKLVILSTDRDLSMMEDINKVVFRLDKVDIFSTVGNLMANLSFLMKNDTRSTRLRELIIDRRRPEFTSTLSKQTVEKVKTLFKALNKPQKTAVLKVLMCKDFVLIKGYPGTGKTSTIVSLVQMLVSLGYSVLLTSYTHSAVDNILTKLINKKVDVLRLGRLERIKPDIHPYSAEHMIRSPYSVAELSRLYHEKPVIATTCLGSKHPVFAKRIFDICIVDEASQVLQPACFGSLFAARKFVLVGDPKQLPPVVQSKAARDLGLAESLINRLDTSGATYELNLQYRMNSDIMSLSNSLTYDGCLQCGSEKVAQGWLSFPNAQILESEPYTGTWVYDALKPCHSKSSIFLDTTQVPAPEEKDRSGLIMNCTEAQIVKIIVHCLKQLGIDSNDIGVIAPYRQQVKVIKATLQSLVDASTVEVNTVDQYQGRDKDIVIISFVKSSQNPDESSSGELLKDSRRLNVAITRARHKLILVGDISTLKVYAPMQKLISLLNDKGSIISLPACSQEILNTLISSNHS